MKAALSWQDIPALRNLYQGYRENLNSDNFYVAHFLPESAQTIISENGQHKIIRLSENERERQAVENLLDDNSGWFDEFVHDDALRQDVTETIRFLFREFSR